MTFNQLEISPRSSKPVHLFVFQLQTKVWRFCTAAQDMTINGNVYKAAPIERTQIKQTTEPPKDKITITMPYRRDPNAKEFPVTQDFGNLWHPYVPTGDVQVTCMATHAGDTSAPAVQWIGVVAQPKFTDTELKLTCQPTRLIDQAKYQGAKWQRSCWKTVYSGGPRGCNLIANSIPVSGTLTAATSPTITVSSLPTASYVGATATWTTSGTTYTANVTARSGTTLTLSKTTGISTGTVVTITIPAPSAQSLTVSSTGQAAITASAFTQQQRDYLNGTVNWTTGGTSYSGKITAADTTNNTLTVDEGLPLANATVTANYSGSITVTGTVSAISSNQITASGFVTQTPTPASLALPATNTQASRTVNVTGASGTTLTIDTGLAVGTSVTAHTDTIDVNTTLQSVNGLTLTSPDFANTKFSLGGSSLRWTRADGLVERRSVMHHNADTITLLYGAADLVAGLAVAVRPGCPHTWAACEARRNTINYGGAIYKPVQDPYNRSMSWG